MLNSRILAINGGSSSLKFALFSRDEPSSRLVWGVVERIGRASSVLTLKDVDGTIQDRTPIDAPDHASAVGVIASYQRFRKVTVEGIGHRIVHGGPKFRQPTPITPEVIDELRRISPFDPDHLPSEISLIEEFGRRFPGVPQVACFDTNFHRTLPRVAYLLPIPRRFEAAGVRKYGFHGLSYQYLMAELARQVGDAGSQGRVILAHLGNGASMAAVKDGRCVDTTMGFTPAAGLVMGTRTGDLDPGLVAFFSRSEGLSPAQFDAMANHESGLLGVSETSADMRDLLAKRAADPRADDAVSLFCYRARCSIGSLAASLGGLETLVFSGGIGEHSPEIRAEICAGLEFLGVTLDLDRNGRNSGVISADGSRVDVRVIPTDEEVTIAREVRRLISY